MTMKKLHCAFHSAAAAVYSLRVITVKPTVVPNLCSSPVYSILLYSSCVLSLILTISPDYQRQPSMRRRV